MFNNKALGFICGTVLVVFLSCISSGARTAEEVIALPTGTLVLDSSGSHYFYQHASAEQVRHYRQGYLASLGDSLKSFWYLHWLFLAFLIPDISLFTAHLSSVSSWGQLLVYPGSYGIYKSMMAGVWLAMLGGQAYSHYHDVRRQMFPGPDDSRYLYKLVPVRVEGRPPLVIMHVIDLDEHRSFYQIMSLPEYAVSEDAGQGIADNLDIQQFAESGQRQIDIFTELAGILRRDNMLLELEAVSAKVKKTQKKHRTIPERHLQLTLQFYDDSLQWQTRQVRFRASDNLLWIEKSLFPWLLDEYWHSWSAPFIDSKVQESSYESALSPEWLKHIISWLKNREASMPLPDGEELLPGPAQIPGCSGSQSRNCINRQLTAVSESPGCLKLDLYGATFFLPNLLAGGNDSLEKAEHSENCLAVLTEPKDDFSGIYTEAHNARETHSHFLADRLWKSLFVSTSYMAVGAGAKAVHHYTFGLSRQQPSYQAPGAGTVSHDPGGAPPASGAVSLEPPVVPYQPVIISPEPVTTPPVTVLQEPLESKEAKETARLPDDIKEESPSPFETQPSSTPPELEPDRRSGSETNSVASATEEQEAEALLDHSPGTDSEYDRYEAESLNEFSMGLPSDTLSVFSRGDNLRASRLSLASMQEDLRNMPVLTKLLEPSVVTQGDVKVKQRQLRTKKHFSPHKDEKNKELFRRRARNEAPHGIIVSSLVMTGLESGTKAEFPSWSTMNRIVSTKMRVLKIPQRSESRMLRYRQFYLGAKDEYESKGSVSLVTAARTYILQVIAEEFSEQRFKVDSEVVESMDTENIIHARFVAAVQSMMVVDEEPQHDHARYIQTYLQDLRLYTDGETRKLIEEHQDVLSVYKSKHSHETHILDTPFKLITLRSWPENKGTLEGDLAELKKTEWKKVRDKAVANAFGVDKSSVRKILHARTEQTPGEDWPSGMLHMAFLKNITPRLNGLRAELDAEFKWLSYQASLMDDTGGDERNRLSEYKQLPEEVVSRVLGISDSINMSDAIALLTEKQKAEHSRVVVRKMESTLEMDTDHFRRLLKESYFQMLVAHMKAQNGASDIVFKEEEMRKLAKQWLTQKLKGNIKKEMPEEDKLQLQVERLVRNIEHYVDKINPLLAVGRGEFTPKDVFSEKTPVQQLDPMVRSSAAEIAGGQDWKQVVEQRIRRYARTIIFSSQATNWYDMDIPFTEKELGSADGLPEGVQWDDNQKLIARRLKAIAYERVQSTAYKVDDSASKKGIVKKTRRLLKASMSLVNKNIATAEVRRQGLMLFIRPLVSSGYIQLGGQYAVNIMNWNRSGEDGDLARKDLVAQWYHKAVTEIMDSEYQQVIKLLKDMKNHVEHYYTKAKLPEDYGNKPVEDFFEGPAKSAKKGEFRLVRLNSIQYSLEQVSTWLDDAQGVATVFDQWKSQMAINKSSARLVQDVKVSVDPLRSHYQEAQQLLVAGHKLERYKMSEKRWEEVSLVIEALENLVKTLDLESEKQTVQ